MRNGRRETRGRPPALTAAGLHGALDAIAPFADAADWDNVGLLAGRLDWPVRNVLLAIDLTDRVAAEALEERAEAVVVYHPPIFKGIRTVTPSAECPTTRLPDLLAARASIFALHTALDHAIGGTNDILLDAFDTDSREPLNPLIRADRQYKLVVFAPAADVEPLRTALSQVGAGVIGHYTQCSFELPGQGTFLGDETTRPAVGRKQALERVDEVRLEMIVPRSRLDAAVRAVYRNHSYEEPAFDVYPNATVAGRAGAGGGRIGRFRKPRRGDALIAALSGVADLSLARVVGSLKRTFTSVTAAAGSFGVSAFGDPGSLVITGEFKHHDALDLLKRGITAVCLDHYASERPVLDVLRTRLSQALPPLSISISRRDASPFALL